MTRSPSKPRRRVKPFRCGYDCDHLIDPTAPPELDTCSYGGGHQSTALLVLARMGKIFDCEVVLDDGILAGCPDCIPAHRATVSIGISLDEIGRANTRTRDAWETVIYPLVGIGRETGLKLRRDDCDRLIREEPLPPEVALLVKQAVADGRLTTPSIVGQLERSGYTTLPIPPKSSCFFCPFHRPAAWADLERETPELFDRSVLLEDTLNARREVLGKDPVWLKRFGIPLRSAIDTEQPLIPGMDDSDSQCDSGYCWT